MVGIGAELNGDDAVGLLVARSLKSAFLPCENIIVLEGGVLPENVTGPLRRFFPELVVFIDAVDMKSPPGTIQVVNPEQISGASFSTHTMPLSMLFKFLKDELNCETLLIGVQPKVIDFGEPVTAEISKAAKSLAKELIIILTESTTSVTNL